MLVDKVLTVLFGSQNDRDVKKLRPLVAAVNAKEEWAKSLSAEEFPKQTLILKDRLAKGETLDDILPEAFALAREAAYRVLGERAYDVQIMGSLVLHSGRITEMKTGEGKTLMCVPAVYLNSLSGKGVHVVTVNDYLAERDANWMRPVYAYLGQTVGSILSDMDNEARKVSYNCDITYGTNNEFGFDYLRDNMQIDLDKKVQRGFNFCVVDEIDSILIDEARTPLIISGQGEDDTYKYHEVDKYVDQLKEVEKDPETGDYPDEVEMDPEQRKKIEGDYKVDEKSKRISFTDKGINKIDEILHKHNLITADSKVVDEENFEYVHYFTQAVRAHVLYKIDVDYLVRDGQVQIVDEFTGRVLEGRRYGDGLHQAIEAKEHLRIAQRNRTLATITFQNFFRMYDKLSGMTGTAATEIVEFNKIYNLDVVAIPTNRPVARIDENDEVYLNEQDKWEAIAKEVAAAHEKGQPVIVGTVSVEKSEHLSALLTRKGIRHEVLNAKNHAREAMIIAEAGAKGAVTIATNMAGRGTDIKLGEGVAELGGLMIIGTERHESRRIDNQLRGRAGRQGDPGVSRFYISLEDDLMRLFGSERLMDVFNSLGFPEGEAIEHKMLSSAVEKAQTKIESNHYAMRKNVLEYDQVMNEQREIMYAERLRVLEGEDMHGVIFKMIRDTVTQHVRMHIPAEKAVEETDMAKLGQKLSVADIDLLELARGLVQIIPYHNVSWNPDEYAGMTMEAFIQLLVDKAIEVYEAKEKEFPDIEQLRELERVVLLKMIDRRWMDHIDNMEQLRQSVGLQAYGQKNPLVEYRFAGYDMFDEMTQGISEDTVQALMHVRIQQPVQREEAAKITGTNKDDTAAKQPVRRKEGKIYPNSPCPCGSGKKYKQCCGRK